MFSIQERLGLGTEAIEGAIYQWACMMRSAIPGIIRTFDPNKQTCTVDVAIMEYTLQEPPASLQAPSVGPINNHPVATPMDTLEDVPVIMMRAGGWSLTFPIVAGTECLLIFADTCIDGWWQNGGQQVPYDRRRHDVSDAFALFGPWSQPNNLQYYSNVSMQLRSDDHQTLIDLSSSAITIVSPNQIVIRAPDVECRASGGTAIPLVNDNFYQWFVNTFLPKVSLTGPLVPPLPTNPETVNLKGQ